MNVMIHFFVRLIQVSGVLIPFGGCGLLVRKAQNRTSTYLLLANLGCLITNTSYLLLRVIRFY